MLTTSAILTCATAPADAFAAAPRAPPSAASAPRRRRAGRIGGSKDRAEVVRILDAVEHDDQRRTSGAAHQFVEAVIGGVVDVSDDSLMHAAARATRRAHRASTRCGLMPCVGGKRQQLPHPIVAALANPQLLDASGPQAPRARD